MNLRCAISRAAACAFAVLLLAAALLCMGGRVALAASSSASSDGEAAASSSADASAAADKTVYPVTYPYTFTNADGSTTEIPAQPERVASTSVSITGTLLALEAPVIATSQDAKGANFAQWASVAEEREVASLWSAGEVNVEALAAQSPDLIVVASSGADSALDYVDQFKEIAPTIIVDYSKYSWQELAEVLGPVVNIDPATLVESYDKYVAEAKEKITVPEGTAAIVSFNGAESNNPIGKNTGPHAALLKALGFTIEEPDQAWHNSGGTRSDFVFASFENLTELTSPTIVFIRSALEGENSAMARYLAEETLANTPAAQTGQLYSMGPNSFRMDYYSAIEAVDALVSQLGSAE